MEQGVLLSIISICYIGLLFGYKQKSMINDKKSIYILEQLPVPHQT